MACPPFADLLRGGDSAANHAVYCDRCRALLEAAAEVDATLESTYAAVSAPPGLVARARVLAARETPLRRPSLFPEILDFIGWAAILTLIAVQIPRVLPAIHALLANRG
jgi:hypothetical protein